MTGLWYLILAILLMWQLIGLRAVTKKSVDKSGDDLKSVNGLTGELEKATSSHKVRDEYIRKIALKNGYSTNDINKAFGIAKTAPPNAQIKMLGKVLKSPEDAFAVAQLVPLANIQKMIDVKNEEVA